MYRIEKSIRFVSRHPAAEVHAMFLKHLSSVDATCDPPFIFHDAPMFAFPGSHGVKIEQKSGITACEDACKRLAGFLSTTIHPEDTLDFFAQNIDEKHPTLWFLVSHGEHEAILKPHAAS